MTKQELINKINHALFDVDKIKSDEYHPFKDYTVEDMQNLQEEFKVTSQQMSQPPASTIYFITSYLTDERLIDFQAEEKQNTDEAWFELLMYKAIGKKGDSEIGKTIIWDSCKYFNHIESLDHFIDEIASIQMDINEFKFFNAIEYQKVI